MRYETWKTYDDSMREIIWLDSAPLLPLFNSAESHQRWKEMLPYSDAANSLRSIKVTKSIVYNILNGGVEEVTRRRRCSTV